MKYECHISADGAHEATAARVPDSVLLDAARERVLTVGVRRTTLADVARTAGVSRMTVYRRFPGIGTLVAALMTDEFGNLLQRIAETTSTGPTARGRIVTGIVQAVTALAEEPLMRGVIDRDPELLLPYLVDRIGSTQRVAERFLHERLHAGHADGSVRAGQTQAQARTLFLLVLSFVLAIRPATSDVDSAALMDELRAHLDAALRPEPETSP